MNQAEYSQAKKSGQVQSAPDTSTGPDLPHEAQDAAFVAETLMEATSWILAAPTTAGA